MQNLFPLEEADISVDGRLFILCCCCFDMTDFEDTQEPSQTQKP